MLSAPMSSPLSPVRSVLFLALSAVVGSLGAACSEDDAGDDKEPVEAGAGTGGAAGAGGGSGSGGVPRAGGAPGAGGFDPALALECAADAGSDECRTCMAAVCCDTYAACMNDAACAEGFIKHRECWTDPANTEPYECFPTFARSVPDAASILGTMVTCILGTCDMCGGPAPL